MKKAMKGCLILMIVLPIGLLVALRPWEILKEPLTISENKTLDVVSWSLERPLADIGIGDSLTRIYREDLSANFTAFIDDYNTPPNEYGSDYLDIPIKITASVDKGFIHFVNITFWEDYEGSQVDIFSAESWSQYAHIENLSITRYIHLFLKGRGLKAFVELAGVNHPNNVSFGFFAHWILRSPKNYTNQLEIRFELIYFNGTAYKRIVQPFLLKAGPDDNNSFEKAQEITANGTYSMLYIGQNDADDYYKVYLNDGYVIYVYATGTSSPKPVFYLDLYDPNGEWRTGTSYACSNTLSFTADSTGYWLIRVHIYDDTSGFYSLYVSLHYPYSSGGGGCPYVYAWNWKSVCN